MSTYSIIKERVTIRDIIENKTPVKLRQDTRDIYTGACYSCGGDAKSTKFRAFPAYYICFDCGIKGDLVDLTADLESKSKKEAFKVLVERYAKEEQYEKYKFRDFKEKKNEDKKENKNNYLKDSIFYEALVKWGKEMLFEKEGKETLEYLTKKRNYSEAKIRQSDFFYMPKVAAAKRYLIGKFPKQKDYINKNLKATVKDKQVSIGLSLSGAYQEIFSLGIPYRDANGNISGLVYRSIEPKGETVTTFRKDSAGKFIKEENKRYNSSGGLDKSDLFNVYNNKKSNNTLIVEGYPDAAYLNAYSELNICAVGTGTVSDSHVESIVKAQIQEVTLSLDNDDLKAKNKSSSEVENFYKKRKKTIDVLRKLHAHQVRTFVIDPEDLGDAKDIDEKYRKEKIDGVIEVLKKKRHSLEYLIYLTEQGKRLLEKQKASAHQINSFVTDKFFDFKSIAGDENYSVFKAMFLKHFKNTVISKKNVNRIESLLNGETSLSDEGIIHALTRLDFNINKKLMPLYSTESLTEKLFPQNLHQILKMIFQQNNVGLSEIKLNKKLRNKLTRIQSDEFLLSLSDTLISAIALQSINIRLSRYHNEILTQIPNVTLVPIDLYFSELEKTTALQEAINK